MISRTKSACRAAHGPTEVRRLRRWEISSRGREYDHLAITLVGRIRSGPRVFSPVLAIASCRSLSEQEDGGQHDPTHAVRSTGRDLNSSCIQSISGRRAAIGKMDGERRRPDLNPEGRAAVAETDLRGAASKRTASQVQALGFKTALTVAQRDFATASR